MSDISDATLETNVLDELPVQEETPTAPQKDETPPAGEGQQPDDLRSAMTELADTVQRLTEPRPPTPPPPSPEQIAEYWKVYDPEAGNKEFFHKWFRMNPDATAEEVSQAKELFAGVQRGLMLQAITAARNYIAMERSSIDEQYRPILDYVEGAKREATRGRFYDQYPGLDDKRFAKIIDATARSLDNKEFTDEDDYFKALAEGAAGSIKEILPEFDAGKKPETTKKPGQPPRLPRTSAGGGGGAGKGSTHDALQPTGRQNDIDSLEEEAPA